MSTQAKSESDGDDAPQTYQDLQEVSRGDVITINGTEHRVVILHTGLRAFLRPPHPTVVSPNGETHDLIFGRIEGSDADGVLWQSELPEDPEPSDIRAGYDDVSIRSGDPEAVYDALPTTDGDICPRCGNESATFEDGTLDGRRTRELRKCTDDDCKSWYVRDRVLPPEDSATVTAYDRNDEEHTIELSGVYRETITSRFKLDPRQRAEERWLTASEVAAFIRKKMDSEEPFGFVRAEARGLRDGPVWKDDKYDQKMKVRFAPLELNE